MADCSKNAAARIRVRVFTKVNQNFDSFLPVPVEELEVLNFWSTIRANLKRIKI